MNDQAEHSKPLLMSIIGIVLISWLANTFILAENKSNLDASILILIIIFIVYKLVYKQGISETLFQAGIRPIGVKRLLLYTSILILFSFLTSYLVAHLLGVDTTNLFRTQKTTGAGIVSLITRYNGIKVVMAISVFCIYGTFLEEFIFRGLIFRKLLGYNFMIANLTQAILFGLLHLLIALVVPLTIPYKIFIFLTPFITALALGYGYKYSQNLLVTWLTHYLVNVSTGLGLLFYGRIF